MEFTNLERAKAKAQEVKDIMAKHREEMKKLFHDGIKETLDMNPGIVAVAWTQYTPYFNDGDTCEFSVHEFGIITLDDDIEEAKYDCYEYGYREKIWDSTLRASRPYQPGDKGYAYQSQKKAVNDFLRAFDDDLYLHMFGDHQRVFISRKGIETEHYDHD